MPGVIARGNVVHAAQVKEKAVEDVKPGDVLAEGVVVRTEMEVHHAHRPVSKQRRTHYLHFVHNTVLAQDEGTTVQILARLEPGMVGAIRLSLGV